MAFKCGSGAGMGSWLPPALSAAEFGRGGNKWLVPQQGQQQGTVTKGTTRDQLWAGRFWQRREEGSSHCNLYYVRNKSLADLAFGSLHKERAILHQSIYNLNRNWIEKIIYSALWFLRQVNRRKLNLSDSSRVTWGFCSTAGNKPR